MGAGSRGTVDTSFRTALRRLDAAGRVVKVRRPVSVEGEVAAILKHNDGDRAWLFERVEGHRIPVVGNFLASTPNCEVALDTDLHGLRELMERGLTDPIPPQLVDEVPVQAVVHTEGIDLGALLPVLAHAPGDGGRFVTAGVVLVRDPATGVANASYHRMQLIGPDRTAIKIDYGRHLLEAFGAAQQAGEPLPISVAVGADLGLLYAAAFMGSQMPPDADELAAAGGIRGAALELAPGITQDVVVPADAEIVLEGVVSPTETVHEGPFGEFVGYHSDAGPAPVVTITAVAHRPDPVYFAINGVGRETVMLRKFVLEASLLRALRSAVPIVADVDLTTGGLHRFHVVIQVAKRTAQHEGWQRNAMLAAFATLKDLDLAVVVDDDIDLHDPIDVEYALATRFEASRDLVAIPAARGHEYVRVSDRGVRTKLGLDATVAVGERDRFARVPFPEVELAPGDVSTDHGSSALPWLGELSAGP